MIQSFIEATPVRRSMLGAGAMLAIAALSAPMSASAQSITFNNPNCTGYTLTGSPPNQTLTCVTGGGGGTSTPSGCSLTPATQQITSAAILGLTAQCTGGTLPITHSFTGAIVGTWQQTSYASGIFIQNNYTQSTSVSVATSNSAGIGPSSTASIVVGSGGGGGGGAGLANCAAQGLTVIPVNGATATYGAEFSDQSSRAGNFGSGDTSVWVYKLTVPASATFSGYPRFVISEFADPATPRQISISPTACDFRPRDITGINGPMAMCSDGTTCTVYYAITGASPSWAGLTPGQTYYISARNWQSPGQSSCSSQHCNALMEHHAQ